jgi:hypothetical protein
MLSSQYDLFHLTIFLFFVIAAAKFSLMIISHVQVIDFIILLLGNDELVLEKALQKGICFLPWHSYST